MTHDGIRPGIDHLLPPIRLDANGRLEELVHGLCPGKDSHADEQQTVSEETDPPGHGKPVKPPVIQCGDWQDGEPGHYEEADKDLIPAFGSLVRVDPG